MHLFYTSAEEIETLVEAFALKTLKKEKWTHAAHLTVAVWYVKQHGFEDALNLVRKGISEYNVAVGTQNTTTSGYHETMTVFWMTVIDFFVRMNATPTMLDTCNALLSGPLASNALPFYFYERNTILSVEARAWFVAPDKVEFTDGALEQILRETAIG